MVPMSPGVDPPRAPRRRMDLRAASAWLAGWWLGLLLCVAAIATPAPFAVLSPPDAGRVVAIVLAREASASLLLGLALALLARWRARQGELPQFAAELALPLLGIGCTVVGYHVLQPWMAAARTAGAGGWSFAQLHAASLGLFGLKIVLVAALGWRLARWPHPPAVRPQASS